MGFQEIAGLKEQIERLEASVRQWERTCASLRSEQALYRNLVEHSLGLMCVHDLNGVLVSINPAAAESLGYAPEDWIGHNLRDFLAPAVKPLFDAYLQRIRKNPTDSGLMRLVSKSGSERIWMYRNIRYSEDGMERVFGHALDVTSRIHAERQLKNSEQRFRTMADHAPVMIWIADTRGDCTFFNKRWLEFTGSTLDEQAGRGWTSKVHPEDLDRLWQVFTESMRTHEPFRVEYRLLRADGEYRWILDTGVPLLEPDRKFGGMIGSCIDITESKQDEQALQRSRDELAERVADRTADLQNVNQKLQSEIEQRELMEEELLRARNMEAIGLLAGGIAHDFNNVLTVIAGNIALAKMQSDPASAGFTALAGAETACERAAFLTRQLLTFAKGGAPVRSIADLGEIVRSCADFTLDGFNVGADVRIPEALWPVEVDAAQISHVIHIVLRNAAQATSAGGTVRILMENALVGPGTLPVAGGKYVRITIRDSGPGIPEKDLPRIFEPYFNRREGASGLALPTAYAIVQKHGGHIAIESAPGAGTSVSVYIPSSTERTAPDPPAAETRPAGRILVMDDEEAIRKIAVQMLALLGYDAETARDGTEAIAVYQEARARGNPFSGIVVDLTVPGGMGGKETIEKLREIDPAVKAIVSSGYSDDPIMSEYRAYGFSGVVEKPWNVAKMREVLLTISQPDVEPM
jgi:PAS domain S-box-containing protein